MAGEDDPEDAISGTPVTEEGSTEPTVDQLVASYRTSDGCTSESASASAGRLQETAGSPSEGGLEALALTGTETVERDREVVDRNT